MISSRNLFYLSVLQTIFNVVGSINSDHIHLELKTTWPGSELMFASALDLSEEKIWETSWLNKQYVYVCMWGGGGSYWIKLKRNHFKAPSFELLLQ